MTLCQSMVLYFNPRSPRGERHTRTKCAVVLVIFQSTLPARGATNVNCPAVCAILISIHAPREGSDHVLLWGFNGNN